MAFFGRFISVCNLATTWPTLDQYGGNSLINSIMSHCFFIRDFSKVTEKVPTIFYSKSKWDYCIRPYEARAERVHSIKLKIYGKRNLIFKKIFKNNSFLQKQDKLCKQSVVTFIYGIRSCWLVPPLIINNNKVRGCKLVEFSVKNIHLLLSKNSSKTIPDISICCLIILAIMGHLSKNVRALYWNWPKFVSYKVTLKKEKLVHKNVAYLQYYRSDQ